MFENAKYCSAGKFISNGKWIHPDRIITSHEIIFVTKGEVYINENGTEYHLKPNEVLFLQPNVRHFGYKPSTNTEFFWLHWNDGPDLPPNIKRRKIENSYTVSLYFRQLLEGCIIQKPNEAFDYLTRLILIELLYNSKPPTSNPIAEKAAALIRANRHTQLTEKQIADTLGYNSDYLNRIFKATFSKTVKQYINDTRIEYIKSLMLNEKLALKDVAHRAGFTDYKYFLKFFKYHEKITPTQFYKQYAKMHINSH